MLSPTKRRPTSLNTTSLQRLKIIQFFVLFCFAQDSILGLQLFLFSLRKKHKNNLPVKKRKLLPVTRFLWFTWRATWKSAVSFHSSYVSRRIAACSFMCCLEFWKFAFMEAIFSRICQPAKWNIFTKKPRRWRISRPRWIFALARSIHQKKPNLSGNYFLLAFNTERCSHVKIVTLYSIVTCLPLRPLVLVRAQKRKQRLLPLHLGNDKVNHESKNKCARA